MLAQTLTGTLQYTYQNYTRPVSGIEIWGTAEVSTWTDNRYTQEFGPVTTGTNGAYSITFPEWVIDGSVQAPYKVYAGPNHSSGLFGFDNPSDLSSDKIEITGITAPLTGDDAHRMYLFDAAAMMHDFYQTHILQNPALTGAPLERLDLDYPEDDNKFVAASIFFDHEIELSSGGENKATWNTVNEEYSHYLQSINNFPSLYFGTHADHGAKNERDFFPNDFEKATQTAFIEGFARFLGNAAQHQMAAETFGWGQPDHIANYISVESPNTAYSQVEDKPGEDAERAIAAALWDFYDGAPNETTNVVGFGDGVNGLFRKDTTRLEYDGLFGLDAIWNAMTDRKPKNFREFWEHILATEDPSVEQHLKYGAILQSARIAAAPHRIQYGTGNQTVEFVFQIPKTTDGKLTLNRFTINVIKEDANGIEFVFISDFNLEHATKVREKARYDEYKSIISIEDWNGILAHRDVDTSATLSWFIESGYEADGDGGSDNVPIYWSDVLPLTLNTAPKVNQGAASPNLQMSGTQGANNQNNTFPVSNLLVNATDPDTGAMGLGGVAIVSADTSIATIEYRNSAEEAFQQLEVEGLGEQNAVGISQDGEIRITTNVPFIGTWDDILELVAVDFDAKRLPQPLLGQRNYGMAGGGSACRCYATFGHLAVCA